MKTDNFIKHWLVTEVDIKPFIIEQNEKDQIKFEQYMRIVGIDKPTTEIPSQVKINDKYTNGKLWGYYISKGNYFVDLCSTSSTPQKIEAFAYTELVAEKNTKCSINVWTYPALNVWVNGNLVCEISSATYKPMQKREVSIDIKQGINKIFVQMQNVGIRDSRNIFGIEILNNTECILNKFINDSIADALCETEKYMLSIDVTDKKVTLPTKSKVKLNITYDNKTDSIKECEYNLPSSVNKFSIETEINGYKFIRNFQYMRNDYKEYHFGEDKEKAHQVYFNTLADKESQKRGSGDYFAILHVLARYATGRQTEKDIGLLHSDLNLIDEHIDCADFLITGFIRLMKFYTLPQEILLHIKEVFLRFRYWMDENGSDGMCFWSENHSLMFHSAQMFLGEMYKDEIFTESGRTGAEQFEIGRLRTKEWLEHTIKDGFEEFTSSTYSAVTIGALLNVVDFADNELSQLASNVLDKMYDIMFSHVFDDVVVAPQGRVYGGVINPALQSNQEFMNFVDDKFPIISANEKYNFNMWISCFDKTKYKLPTALVNKYPTKLSIKYTTEHAEINIYKNENYILTSVSSPREDFDFKINTNCEMYSREWVKNMNMRFHGRTCFEPGVYGYQQHLWYSALDKYCNIFINSPGTPVYEKSMRPGYWYGNGIMPFMKQEENKLFIIYNIDDTYPIKFTHLFFPTNMFDEYHIKEKWLFGKRKNGYVGIWSSETLEKYTDVLVDTEYRSYNNKTAYICINSDVDEFITFGDFINDCTAQKIAFNEENLTLSYNNNEYKYHKYNDTTQYI